ncbi:MAG: leucine-rich repeat domain-containing protein, partial [Clostridia bacterium]|nr:leucine-rich repeat domain-containing protein [Clostridia bacterium]
MWKGFMKKLLLIMLIAFVGILIFCGCSSPDLDDVFTKLNNAKTMEIEMVMRQVQPKESRELMSMYVIANGKGKEKYTYTKAVVEENTKEVYVVDNNIFTCLNTVLQSAEQQESTMFNTEQDKMVELFSLDFEEMQYSITTEKLDKDRTNYIYQFSKNDLASMFGNFLGSSYFESCKMNLIVKDRTKLPESMYIEFVYNANNKITCDIIYKNINKTIKKSLPKVLKSINPKEFGIEYDLLNENEYQVSRYTNTNNTVVIPSTYNGLPVTSIGNNAFAYKETLKYVTLPESITSIGNYCFASGSFYSIRRITLSKNLTYIGKYAFSNSNSEIIFPNGSVIEEISPFAFYEYKG